MVHIITKNLHKKLVMVRLILQLDYLMSWLDFKYAFQLIVVSKISSETCTGRLITHWSRELLHIEHDILLDRSDHYLKGDHKMCDLIWDSDDKSTTVIRSLIFLRTVVYSTSTNSPCPYLLHGYILKNGRCWIIYMTTPYWQTSIYNEAL